MGLWLINLFTFHYICRGWYIKLLCHIMEYQTMNIINNTYKHAYSCHLSSRSVCYQCTVHVHHLKAKAWAVINYRVTSDLHPLWWFQTPAVSGPHPPRCSVCLWFVPCGADWAVIPTYWWKILQFCQTPWKHSESSTNNPVIWNTSWERR